MAETVQFLSSPTHLFACFSSICDSLMNRLLETNGRLEAQRKFDNNVLKETKEVLDVLLTASLWLEALHDKDTRLSA